MSLFRLQKLESQLLKVHTYLTIRNIQHNIDIINQTLLETFRELWTLCICMWLKNVKNLYKRVGEGLELYYIVYRLPSYSRYVQCKTRS